MKLSRICSEFSYGKWLIHQFGYDEDGTFKKDDDEIKDWFYFKSDKLEYLEPFTNLTFPEKTVTRKSLFGDKVVKVQYTSIKQKKTVEETYPEYTFESDVSPEFKHVLAHKSKWSDHTQRHILYFDIETFSTDIDASKPERPRAPVTCIAAYSTKFKRYFIFSWHEIHTEDIIEPKIVEKNNTTYIFCHDERDVLTSFIYFIGDYDVDIITGWYSAGFDVPYIINRCNVLGINASILSPINQVKCYKKGEFWKTYILGLDHIDMLEAVQDLGYNLTNYKLATAAKEILKNPDVEKLTEVTWKDWPTNYKGFLEYAHRDVEILKELDEAKGIFELFCKIQQLTNITMLSEVLHKSSVVDKYILSEYSGQYVFPTRHTQPRQSYMGAIVLDPTEPGVHEDVSVLDFASLYPTSIMSFNLSPETFIASEESLKDMNIAPADVISRLNESNIPFVDTGHDDELFGKRYLFYSHEHKLGILPKILKKLYTERRSIKAKMNLLDNHSEEYGRLYKHQDAIKLILNSSYGAMGFPYFRLYTPEVADAITYFARQALLRAAEIANQDGFTVLYGDTDSIFVRRNGKSIAEVDSWVASFNDNLKSKFIPSYGIGLNSDYGMLELENEKDLERIYFGMVKKRYYAIVRPDGEKYIRGMNIIRKDAPAFVKDKLNVLAELAVKNELTVDHLITIRSEIEHIPYDQLGVVKRFGRRFDQFKVKPQHLKAALWANTIIDDCNITHRDTPYLFYIVSKCEDDLKIKDRHDAICILEEDLSKIDLSDKFDIDYETFFMKQFLKQISEFDKIESVKLVVKQYKEWLKREKIPA